MSIDISKIKRAYFVGIKGVAQCALALYMKQKGVDVLGSDVPDIFPTDEELSRAYISIFTEFSSYRFQGDYIPDVVIYTGAHKGRENVEVLSAIAAGIPAYPNGQALGIVMEPYRQIAVGGSHGKTTTSAMIATILKTAHFDPSYAIGCGSIGGLDSTGAYGKGPWFVAEADEYITDPGHDKTPRFLWMKPEIFVVTNIDFDHPDAYSDIRAVQHAFKTLQDNQVGQQVTIVNRDNPESDILLHGPNVITYGFSPRADFCITHVGDGKERMFFTVTQHGIEVGEFTLKVSGKHNVANATAAVIAAHIAGVTWTDIRLGLLAFTGTKRRFEKIAQLDSVVFYDDYAHHPNEIAATIAGARRWYPDQRIIAIFQPHTYSRTKALLSEFAVALSGADVTILTDIYASARESDTLGITSGTLIEQVAQRSQNVYFAPTEQQVTAKLIQELKPNDVVIFMGAGDIFTWEKFVIEKLTKVFVKTI